MTKSLDAVTTRFAFKLFNALLTHERGNNVFISPLSVALTLALAYNGAAGDTQRAMAAALELGDATIDDLNQANHALIRDLNSLDPAVTLAIANSLWANQDVQFNSAFLRRAEQFYEAEVATLDFGDSRAAATINRWVQQHTNGKIEQIIDQIDPSAMLFLINAIYFKGRWTDEFDPRKTRPRPFMLANGQQRQHPMMAQGGSYRYLDGGGFQAINLPYGGERLSMYVFLPDKRASLEAWCQSLTHENWHTWMRRFRKAEGDIVLPRFTLEYEATLNVILEQLGMGIAFARRRADFSAMCNQQPAYIDQIKHKTFVEVNEEGTEAAAVTSVEFRVASFMPSKRFNMVVDRPFVCAIVDNNTALPLFLGAIVEPRS